MQMTRPGFKDTADLFAKCARKERDPDRRAEHIRSEAFYRSLASITPTFPPKYSMPRLNGDRYLDRAEECRTMADCFTDPECRRQMIELANTYENMAKQLSGRPCQRQELQSSSRVPSVEHSFETNLQIYKFLRVGNLIVRGRRA